MSRSLGAFPRFLNDANGLFRLNERRLVDHLLMKPNRAILLLDGLDEVFDTGQRQNIVDDILRFCNSYPATRVVVTSRVVDFESHNLRCAKFRHFVLQDLDKKQITQFIDKWHNEAYGDRGDGEAKRERLRNAISNSEPIAMLAGNPLLLTMMAILNRNQELPRGRAELYAQASRVLLHQWDAGRALKEYPQLRGEVDLRAKQEILRRVAFAMQSSRSGLRGNTIDGDELTDLIEEYLRDKLRFDQSRAAANALVTQLRARNFVLCSIGGNRYAFVHRTFLEFYCADHYIDLYKERRKLEAEDIAKVFEDHCCEQSWQEVLRLICSQIDEKLVNRVVMNLATRTNINECDGLTPVPELLLAVRIIEDADPGTIQESSGAAVFNAVADMLANCKVRGNRSDAPMFGFIQQMREAAFQAGEHWPGVSEPESIKFPEWGPECNFAYFGLACLIAALSKDRTPLLKMVESDKLMIRASAVSALSKKWPDATTKALLVKLATTDIENYIRFLSLNTLLTYWQDERTRALLIRAVESDSAIVAPYLNPDFLLNQLVRHFPDDRTRDFLADVAVNHKNQQLREGAVSGLAQGWRNEATRSLLKELAADLDDGNARCHALNCLMVAWPDQDTLEFMWSRVRDEQPELKSAIAMGAEGLQTSLEKGTRVHGVFRSSTFVLTPPN